MNEKEIKLSIIVCTHNRAEILQDCLQSLATQTRSSDYFEVLVVNNNSVDHTENVVSEFLKNFPNFRLIKEPKTGLSHARNKGYQEAKHDWVSYIDDDAKAHENYVERALDTIQKYGYECIGGVFLPWYKYGEAKWLPHNIISNLTTTPDNSVEIIQHDNACGGVIILKKSVLKEVGGFPIQLGMSGNKIAYGEEDAVQMALRKKGYTVALDQGLRIDHLVSKYKLDWRWHARAMYGRGAAEMELHQPKLNYSLLLLIAGTMVFPLLKIPYLSWKLLSKKDFYWQNALIDFFGAPMYYRGRHDKYREIQKQK